MKKIKSVCVWHNRTRNNSEYLNIIVEFIDGGQEKLFLFKNTRKFSEKSPDFLYRLKTEVIHEEKRALDGSVLYCDDAGGYYD